MKRLNTILDKLIKHSYFTLLIYSILFTGISYISINTTSQIYDYSFHLARIIGLAQSIQNNDWLPNLNFLFLNGAGYAVPMFYGNWMFYIPALVFLATKVGTLAFTSFVFLLTLATSFTSYYAASKITGSKKRALVFAIVAPTLTTYFGFGMTAVAPLIPLLIYAIYKVLYLDDLNPILLSVVVALLVQTHIISTLVLAIASLILVILNIKRLNFKKIVSFFSSIFIAILLSLGFIFQYIEQSQSQVFFVNWKLRDFPFPTAALMTSENIIQIVKNYYFPLSLIILLITFIYFKKINTFSKQLVLLSTILLVSSSEILPWENFLKYSFLAVFQYSTRLIYFLPFFIFMAICFSAPKKFSIIVVFLQLFVYLFTNPFAFLPNSSNYVKKYGLIDSNINVMRSQNSKAVNAFTNPTLTTYDTSGDEYLNLDINHENARNGVINQFVYNENLVQLNNIKQGYNNLEFDVEMSSSNEQKIVLPRIWYKGYSAYYSNGIKGTQPKIEYNNLSFEEKKQYVEARKPDITKKVLFDGRAVIKVSGSGHVRVTYQKTTLQVIGFLLELLSFIIVGAYVVVNSFRLKVNK